MEKKIFDDQLIIITGAAGFIGSGVVRHLNDRGLANLLLVDDLRVSEKWKNLRNKRFVDLISRRNIFEYLKGREREIEAFIHLGACSDTRETDGDYMVDNNYRFSVSLAEYALENEHRFIYASSAATYGDGTSSFSDDEARLDSLTPPNLYSFSKHMFDKWLQERGVLDRVVGLKYFNIFGPNEWHKGRLASMVMHMLHQIQKTGGVRLFRSNDPERFEDGEQCRDFLYVKDAVKMTCFFLDHDLNGIFNVGSGEARSFNLVAKSLFQALGKKENVTYSPFPEDLEGAYQNYVCADMTKFQRELDKNGLTFTTDFTFELAIDDYINRYFMKGRRW